jgi:5-methyltetrahydropteroyltriglutamate--homocysteine methyltransferase
MKHNADRIRTSHVGALPPSDDWNAIRGQAAKAGAEGFAAAVAPVVLDLVRRQTGVGLDCIGDGEFWAGRGFMHYAQHFSGVTIRPLKPGERGSMREETREREVFPKLYADMDRDGTLFCVPGAKPVPPLTGRMVISGPLKYNGTATIEREIDAFKAAIAQAGVPVDEAFICALAPGWLDHFIYNEYYRTDEEYVFALAEAMRDEYRAIADAGFILQIDDPGVATSWDMMKPAPGLAEYRRYIGRRAEALNHALAGIPEDRIRYHFCWGSWHGAHTHDIPLRDIVDDVLRVRAQCYSFEASNVRHEHEWRVWQDVKLPPGKVLMPGVVSHATNIVEHPELIAERITRFANIVGRENVLAGTDCGLGHRLHPELVWAKFAALVEGAKLASKTLWK